MSGFAAPELLDGQALSASADVYGVACVIYEERTHLQDLALMVETELNRASDMAKATA